MGPGARVKKGEPPPIPATEGPTANRRPDAVRYNDNSATALETAIGDSDTVCAVGINHNAFNTSHLGGWCLSRA